MLEMHNELSDFHRMGTSAQPALETTEGKPSNPGEVNPWVCATAGKTISKYHNALANKTFCLREDRVQQQPARIITFVILKY